MNQRRIVAVAAAVVLALATWTAFTAARTGRERTMMINKSTPVLHVKSVEPSVKFWTERFGFKKTVEVPEGDHVVPIGVADVKRAGEDVTIVATSRMVQVALAAAELLAADGISAEVVDPRSLVPLDVATLVESVRKTSRAVVVDGGYRQYGVTGEIAATLAEQAFDWLDAPVLRVCGKDVPMPYAANLEKLALPQPEDIVAAVKAVCYR